MRTMKIIKVFTNGLIKVMQSSVPCVYFILHTVVRIREGGGGAKVEGAATGTKNYGTPGYLGLASISSSGGGIE